MTLGPGSILGPYVVTGRLGSGGMGVVWRARDERLGREVAVKVLPEGLGTDPESSARFQREARAAAALQHPNVLAVHDVGTAGGAPYIVYELLAGDTLRAKLAGGALPAAEVLEIALQAARGLAAAHARGIVHRDLKPENVFLTADGWVKVLDFGLAKLTGPVAGEGLSGAETLRGSTPGAVLGTLGYMAPEQLRGEPADARADVFAFGTLVYEMLAGQSPFRRPSAAESIAAVLFAEPPPLATTGTAAALEELARRCLAKAPPARPSSLADVAGELDVLKAGGERTTSSAARALAPPRRPFALAVLPFRDLGSASGGDGSPLALGLADAIITELARLRSLVVRPTAAILAYRDRLVAPVEAAAALGVDAVVAGSFQVAGSRLRVTVQLVDAAGEPLWGDKIDAAHDDVFRVQDEVSRQVAAALPIELGAADRRRSGPAAAAPAARAYLAYLEGRSRLHGLWTADACRAAATAFEEAVALDPGFALGWAGLADAAVRLAFSFEPEGGWYERAQRAVARAFELEPGLPEAHYVAGRLAWSPRGGFDVPASLRAFLAAVRARPSLHDAHHYVGQVLMHVSVASEASAAIERALAINPIDLAVAIHLGTCRQYAGRFEEARRLSRDVLERSPSAWGFYQIAGCEARLDDWDGARRTIEDGEAAFPGDGWFLSARAILSAHAGDSEAALAWEKRTVERKKAFGHFHHAQHDFACARALLGEPAAAIAWLEAAAANGFPCGRAFAADSLLASLRAEAGFRDLLSRLESQAAGYERLFRELQDTT